MKGRVVGASQTRDGSPSAKENKTVNAMKSVLHNFLGAFTSRYTEYKGYWIFGFLIGEFTTELTFDLMVPRFSETVTPLQKAASLASIKFATQVLKAKIKPDTIQEAQLSLFPLSDLVQGLVNGQEVKGRSVNFRVVAVMKSGEKIISERTIFVAPHNPSIELQSTGFADN